MTFGKRNAPEDTNASDGVAIDDFVRVTNFISGENNARMRDALKRYAQTQIDTTHGDGAVMDSIAAEIQTILRHEGKKRSLADVKRDLAAAHAKGRLVSSTW